MREIDVRTDDDGHLDLSSRDGTPPHMSAVRRIRERVEAHHGSLPLRDSPESLVAWATMNDDGEILTIAVIEQPEPDD